MKGKKYKRSTGFMRKIFEKAFGLRQPYQVLVDAEFCRELLKCKLIAKDLIPEALGGPSKIMVSGCVLDELRRLDEAGVGGDAMSGSVFVAKRFELRNCRHSGQGFDSSACIKDLIGLDNPHHYAVAAQNVELRGALREILGVPLILINRGVLVMEQPSKATIDQARKIELNKLKASEFENKAISKILADKADPEAEKQAKPEKRKRKKKNKSQPNPLSVKRSKKDQNTVESTQSSGVAVVGKPKRKRRSKKKVAPTDTL